MVHYVFHDGKYLHLKQSVSHSPADGGKKKLN